MISFFLLLCFALSLYPSQGVSIRSSNASAMQMFALLSFKSMVSDPSGSLLPWNHSNHLCSWHGVECGHKHPGRVVKLNLNSLGLLGHISPFLGNLSYLRELDLGENQLRGEIPHELSHLSKLRVLNLSSNSLQGSIPATLVGGCVELVKLDLHTNHLRGDIPGEIGDLRNLVYLKLDGNHLSGEIPPSLGNLSSLTSLHLANNTLSGEIPTSLGNLSNLKLLDLWMNRLSGHIPSSLTRIPDLSSIDLENNNLTGPIPHAIWNISSLTLFAVTFNELTGAIPPNIFNKLSLLQIFNVGFNQFHGHLPSSLVNASDLSYFQVSYNYFSGVVPPELGGLNSLQNLLLSNNVLEAKDPQDWNFLVSLTNCSQLQVLDLSFNRFSGVLPSEVSNLSTTFTYFNLGNNRLAGGLPKEIGNLVNLNLLVLQNNSLTGSLPSSIGTLQNLQVLLLQNNSLSGPIPPTIGNLTKLYYLVLAMNNFSGTIPTTTGNMMSLTTLDFSINNFTGTIPSSLFNITSLSIYFGISDNHLEGSIPPEVGNLLNLVEFDAKFNRLSGEIPVTLGKCRLLQFLYLQSNSFVGNIPSFLSGLNGLEFLDLSSNNFSGQIPEFLGDFRALSDLNLSFNNFYGEVPTVGVFANATAISVLGNNKLCGGIKELHLPPCSLQFSKKGHKFPMVVIVVPLVATVTCIISLLLFLLGWHKKRSTKSTPTMSMQGHQIVSYPQLLHATDGFSSTNLLGTGSYGSVYRGKLYEENGENEHLIAIKVLKLQTPGALKSFTAECEAMRNLRHRNLVKIITACSSIDFSGNEFKAIVFDFMPNGSLDDWLHSSTNDKAEERHLSLNQRVSILIDVAYALDYLHFNGAAPIVHCDLKPSNVLLDAEMVAHVGDFGLAKILAEECTSHEPSMSSLGFRGTIGYVPPEYGAGNIVSTHGDIYSYGILSLEMITGRRPTDNTFDGIIDLCKHVEMALNNSVMEVIDKELVMELENENGTTGGPSSKRRVNSMISLLKLGMLCSVEMPSRRMSTKEIIKELHLIKKTLAYREEGSR